MPGDPFECLEEQAKVLPDLTAGELARMFEGLANAEFVLAPTAHVTSVRVYACLKAPPAELQAELHAEPQAEPSELERAGAAQWHLVRTSYFDPTARRFGIAVMWLGYLPPQWLALCQKRTVDSTLERDLDEMRKMQGVCDPATLQPSSLLYVLTTVLRTVLRVWMRELPSAKNADNLSSPFSLESLHAFNELEFWHICVLPQPTPQTSRCALF
jgi:hypothetical protein